MATIITNQARLNYRYGTTRATAVSNIATTVLNSQLSVSKSSLSGCYRIGQNLTYVLSVSNNSSMATEGITVTDNMGTYTFNGTNLTPLSFVGPAQLYINGAFVSEITPVINENNIVFSINSIPANGNAQIVYLALVNEYARCAIGSQIENTVTVETDCGCPCDIPSESSSTIPVCESADVRMVKTICPNPVVCGGELTYTFVLYNYGNVTATDVILTDTFRPTLENITVTVNGATVDSDDYDYINGTLTLPAVDSEFNITIPAATCSQNPNTGVVTPTPGSVQVTVSGNL